MKIRELTPPIKVKLNSKFVADTTFDPHAIIMVKLYYEDKYTDEEDVEKMYVVHVSALKEDFKHNSSVAIPNWYDANNDPKLTYYDTHKPNIHGDYDEVLYVMENDDVFDEIVHENHLDEAVELLKYVYDGLDYVSKGKIDEFLTKIKQ